MRILSRVMSAMSLLVPFASQAAQQWSGCPAITGVSNYMAYNNDNLSRAHPRHSPPALNANRVYRDAKLVD